MKYVFYRDSEPTHRQTHTRTHGLITGQSEHWLPRMFFNPNHDGIYLLWDFMDSASNPLSGLPQLYTNIQIRISIHTEIPPNSSMYSFHFYKHIQFLIVKIYRWDECYKWSTFKSDHQWTDYWNILLGTYFK